MPGWQWTVLDVQWEEAFQAVKNYLESRGHSYPPTGYVEGGINLGRWIGKQRSAFLKNPHNPLFAELLQDWRVCLAGYGEWILARKRLRLDSRHYYDSLKKKAMPLFHEDMSTMV